MIKVFLDDIRTAPPDWVHVVDTNSCLILLRQGLVEELSLDCDLGEDNASVTWLVSQIAKDVQDGLYPFPEFLVHSQNPTMIRKIEQILKSVSSPCLYSC